MLINESNCPMDVYIGKKRIIHNSLNPVGDAKKKLGITKTLEGWFCGAFGIQASIVEPSTLETVFQVRYGESSKFYQKLK